MRTLLVSFVYPLIEEYIKEFFLSIKRQSTKEFDTLIFNDKFNNNLKEYDYNGNVISNDNNLDVFEVRKFIIDYSIDNNYDLLIFADADDVMANDRVEKLVEAYDENISFFYNNLYLLSNREVDFYKGRLPSKVDNLENIKEYNFLGMSHTAINIKKEKDILKEMPITKKMIAFDWYLYSYLLMNGACGKKVDTKTYYRIYDNNIVGETDFLNEKKLNVGLKVKKYHYNFMTQFDRSYNKLFKKIIELEEKLEDDAFKKRYIDFVNQTSSANVFWWENIKLLDNVKVGINSD